jgi:hypothetical protein
MSAEECFAQQRVVDVKRKARWQDWAAITCANGDRVLIVCSVIQRESASIEAGTGGKVPTKTGSTTLRDCLFMAMEKTNL